jgi:hypothetical protein
VAVSFSSTPRTLCPGLIFTPVAAFCVSSTLHAPRPHLIFPFTLCLCLLRSGPLSCFSHGHPPIFVLLGWVFPVRFFPRGFPTGFFIRPSSLYRVLTLSIPVFTFVQCQVCSHLYTLALHFAAPEDTTWRSFVFSPLTSFVLIFTSCELLLLFG